jgi:hypothetical protein
MRHVAVGLSGLERNGYTVCDHCAFAQVDEDLEARKREMALRLAQGKVTVLECQDLFEGMAPQVCHGRAPQSLPAVHLPSSHAATRHAFSKLSHATYVTCHIRLSHQTVTCLI